MKWLMLAVFIVISFVPALAGGRSMPGEWYQALRKPSFNPPAWVFGPVWTLLYASMGVAAWMVWRAAGNWRAASLPLSVFALQLVFNGLWSWLFFGLHRPDLALLDILALWLAILGTIVVFWQKSPAAGALLFPYLAWVSFAAILNAALWHLNR